LLQMQHKQLVKSLHCEQINPYIELEGSPFYIVQENQAWMVLRDHAGKALPRRAGVSSFGFGGVNAHVVLEEYVPKPRMAQPGSKGAIIVLSAKNEERLQEQVRQLLAWIAVDAHRGNNLPLSVGAEQAQDLSQALSLQDVAYTLQVGRDA